MTTKTNALRAAMQELQDYPQDGRQPSTQAEPRERKVAQTRVGKRAVGGFISAEGYRQLHLIALDRDCSIQDLVVEALNDLFRKHNKSAIG